MIAKGTYASEEGHWYTKNGEPAYTQISQKGTERPTTLRDARKLNLVPSVTTILKVADKPALTAWKVRQALLAALTLPQEEGESLDAFMRRADADAKEQARAAAEEGSRIHAAVECFFLERPYSSDYAEHVAGAVACVKDAFPGREWSAEKSFASEMGFGGKVDLHCEDVVIDFKTKDFGPEDDVRAWDEQAMQLDAYRNGLCHPGAHMANVYISRTHPGLARLVLHEEGDHYARFLLLLQYWKLSKKYHP